MTKVSRPPLQSTPDPMLAQWRQGTDRHNARMQRGQHSPRHGTAPARGHASKSVSETWRAEKDEGAETLLGRGSRDDNSPVRMRSPSASALKTLPIMMLLANARLPGAESAPWGRVDAGALKPADGGAAPDAPALPPSELLRQGEAGSGLPRQPLKMHTTPVAGARVERSPQARGPAARRSAACAPDGDVISQAIRSLPTRRRVAAEILRKHGLDPEEEYRFTESHIGGGIGGNYIVNKLPLIDLYIKSQVTTFPFFLRHDPDVLKALPDLNSRFRQAFGAHVDKTAEIAFHKAMDRLSAAGIGAQDRVSLLSAEATKLKPGIGHALLAYYIRGNRGAVLEAEGKDGSRYFAIVPSHCDTVIALREDEKARTAWIKDNQRLFFESDINRPSATTSFQTVVTKKDLNARQAIAESTSQAVRSVLSPLEEKAFAETWFETIIHMGHDVVVPYYGATREAVKGNYGKATAHAFLDTALMAGAPGKAANVVKSALRTRGVTNLARGADAVDTIAKAAKGHLDEAAEAVLKARKGADDVAESLSQAGKRVDEAGALARRARPNGPRDGAPAARPKPAKLPFGAASSRKRPKEFVRTFPETSGISQSPAVRNEVGNLNRLMRENRELRPFFDNPAENCADVLEPVASILKGAGYETRYRGMYLWDDAKDIMPNNHFVVLARKDGIDYAVDVTAGQFSEFKLPRGMIDTEEAWARTLHAAAKGTLIKYKDFKDITQATNAFYAGKLFVDPMDPMEGAIILTKPAWYKRPSAVSYKVTDNLGRIVERMGNRYSVKKAGRSG